MEDYVPHLHNCYPVGKMTLILPILLILPINDDFRYRQWGSSLPSQRTLDPPLSPPSTLVENSWRMCLQSNLHKFQNKTLKP
jgi:hypothetical protein